MSNWVEITSADEFKAELSKDLNRVSVLNFWAKFAEPCEAFNKSVQDEATKFPRVLFLNVCRGGCCADGRSRQRSRRTLRRRLTSRLFPASCCSV